MRRLIEISGNSVSFPPLRPSVLLPFIPGHLLCAPIPTYILYRSFPALTSLIPVRILRLHIGVPVALRHCYILFMDPLFHLFFIIIFLKPGNELIQHKLLPVQQIRHLVYSLDKQYIFGVHMLHKKTINITKRRVLLPHPLRIINKAVFPGWPYPIT